MMGNGRALIEERDGKCEDESEIEETTVKSVKDAGKDVGGAGSECRACIQFANMKHESHAPRSSCRHALDGIIRTCEHNLSICWPCSALQCACRSA